jgi:hypothetical protein
MKFRSGNFKLKVPWPRKIVGRVTNEIFCGNAKISLPEIYFNESNGSKHKTRQAALKGILAR